MVFTLELVDPPTRRVLQTLPALPTHRVLSYCAADVVEYLATILSPELQRLASSLGLPKGSPGNVVLKRGWKIRLSAIMRWTSIFVANGGRVDKCGFPDGTSDPPFIEEVAANYFLAKRYRHFVSTAWNDPVYSLGTGVIRVCLGIAHVFSTSLEYIVHETAHLSTVEIAIYGVKRRFPRVRVDHIMRTLAEYVPDARNRIRWSDVFGAPVARLSQRWNALLDEVQP